MQSFFMRIPKTDQTAGMHWAHIRSRGGSRRISEGVWTDKPEQCTPRSNAANVASDQVLHKLAILHTFTGSKMDLLKRSVRKSVLNLSNLSKISHDNPHPEPPLNPPLRRYLFSCYGSFLRCVLRYQETYFYKTYFL